MRAGLTDEQYAAVLFGARAFGWDQMPTHDLGMLVWMLFRYYVLRLGAAQESEVKR